MQSRDAQHLEGIPSVGIDRKYGLFFGAGAPGVLLVDNHLDYVVLLKDYLEWRGYRVFTAQDGESALILAETAPRVCTVLMDLVLPDMTGYELARYLKASSSYRSVPMVAVSGRAAESHEDLFAATLMKPVDPDLLSQLIAAFCKRSSPNLPN